MKKKYIDGSRDIAIGYKADWLLLNGAGGLPDFENTWQKNIIANDTPSKIKKYMQNLKDEKRRPIKNLSKNIPSQWSHIDTFFHYHGKKRHIYDSAPIALFS